MLRFGLVLALLAVADATVAQQPQQNIGASATDNAAVFRGQNGRRVTYVCPANINLAASLWGTNVYTDDSPICLSAIHANALERGRAGVVTLVIGGAVASFEGTTQNGVTSRGYTSYPSSMTFDRGGPPGQADWTTTGRGIPADFTGPIVVTCPPNGTAASVWGTDIYSEDSSICSAAVHANVITLANGGDIAVTAAPRTTSFRGTPRNGISSQGYANPYGAFRVAAPGAAPAAPPATVTTGDITGIAVRVTVATATVTWTPVAGALGYVVMRWKSGDASCCNTVSAPGALLMTNTWVDSSPLQSAGTYGFRIYAHTPSGVLMGETLVDWNGVQTPTTQLLSRGAAVDPVRAATRQTPAATAAGVTAPQPSPPPVGAEENARPPPGRPVGSGTPQPQVTPQNSPTQPGGQGVGGGSTIDARPDLAQDPASSGPGLVTGRYRVMLLSAEARETTRDDINQLDGIGDEIAPAAAMLLFDRASKTEKARGFFAGVEYGSDLARLKAADRIRAGSGLGGGGIQTNDVVPDGFAVTTPVTATTNDRFPLEVFNGTLTDGAEVLLIVPSLWERDVGRGPFDLYAVAWTAGPSATTIEAASSQVGLPDILPYESPIRPGPPMTFNLGAVALNADHRPIGLRAMPLVAPYYERYVVITSEKLRLLGAPGAFQDILVNFSEPRDPVLRGTYQLRLRVERLE